MAMGIPVITNSGVGDVKSIVEKYKAGFVLDDFSDQTFKTLIDKMETAVPFNRAYIRKGAEDFYSLENAVALYKSGYDKVLR